MDFREHDQRLRSGRLPENSPMVCQVDAVDAALKFIGVESSRDEVIDMLTGIESGFDGTGLIRCESPFV